MILSLGLLSVWGFALGLTVWGTLYSLGQLRRFKVSEKLAARHPISLLKPLKGMEAGIRENLESFFQLQYPCFEILFSVADAKDPVIQLVEELQAKYPLVDTHLIVGAVNVGPNPKVNNLVKSYDAAKYDWRLISDSNTRVESEYLYHLVPYLRPDVGVISAVVVGSHAEDFAGNLEECYLNTFFARWTFVADFFGKPFVIGKSMCFRKTTAERFGGVRNLSHYIAEDNMFGQAVLRLGMKIKIMSMPVNQHIGKYEFKNFWARHVRWGRIRKSQAAFAFLSEPIANCMLPGLMGAWGIHLLFGQGAGLLFVLHCLVWAAFDFLLMKKLGAKIDLKCFIAWTVRELIAVPHWVHMAWGDHVNWRGRKLKILPGGLVVDPEQMKNIGESAQSIHWKSSKRIVGIGSPD